MRIYKIAQAENALFDHFGINHDQTSLSDFLSFETEYDIPIQKLNEFVRKGLRFQNFKFAICIYEGEKPYWFTINSDGTFDYQSDIEDWFNAIDEDDTLQYLGMTEDDLYISDIGPLRDIRENPGTVYHYTNEDALEEIQKSGHVGQSWGSGLGNRGAHGLFVSMNPDEYADGTYGNILLTIDLQKFKEENGLKALAIDIEPQYKEYLCKEVLASRLGLEYRGDVPTDISMNTLIVGHNIPLKYVTVGKG